MRILENWRVSNVFVKQAGYCAENRGRIAVTLSIGEKFCLSSSWCKYLSLDIFPFNFWHCKQWWNEYLITKMYTSF